MNLPHRFRKLVRDRRRRQHERHGDLRDLQDRRSARERAEPVTLVERLTTDTTNLGPDDMAATSSSDDNAPDREFELAVQRAAEAFASSIGRPWAVTLVADKLCLVADLDPTLRNDAGDETK